VTAQFESRFDNRHERRPRTLFVAHTLGPCRDLDTSASGAGGNEGTRGTQLRWPLSKCPPTPALRERNECGEARSIDGSESALETEGGALCG
jgi:hypothetical protein